MWIRIHFLWIGSCCSFQRGSWFSIFLNANSDPDPAYTNLYKITKWTVEKDKNDCLKVRNHGAGPNLLNLKNKITFTNNFLACFLFLPPNFSSWIRIPILMCMWIREGERMQILAYLDPKLCSICTKGMKSLQNISLLQIRPHLGPPTLLGPLKTILLRMLSLRFQLWLLHVMSLPPRNEVRFENVTQSGCRPASCFFLQSWGLTCQT